MKRYCYCRIKKSLD